MTSRQRQPRDERGRFLRMLPAQSPENVAATVSTLYEWRAARRDYQTQLAATNREQRFGAVRSLGLFMLMSAAMAGVLMASLVN
jgi:hypothetical protein